MKAEIFLDFRSDLGECPIWDGATDSLWWVDIHRCLVMQFVAGDPAPRSHRFDSTVGAIALAADGHVLVALADRFVDYDAVRRREALVARADLGHSEVRLNDGRCDRQGRFICGGMDMTESGRRSASVYSLGAGGQVQTLFQGISCANSICFSPDGSRMYFSDMPTREIMAFDYDSDDCVASNPVVFATKDSAAGLPDGSVTDAEGCLWNARWGCGQVIRYAPDGRVDRTIDLPVSNVTCVAFGGPGYSTLFVTTASHGLSPEQKLSQPAAGSIFAIDAGVRGLPEAPYIGSTHRGIH